MPGPVIAGEMPALTGLRGFAAVWVMIYHAWVFSGPRIITFDFLGTTFSVTSFISTGWSGVQIFFVLSGFLLSLPFVRWKMGLRDRPEIKMYLLRRVARVFPAYYLQLVLLLGIGWFFQNKLLIPFTEIPQYLLMLFVPTPLGVGSSPLNGVWWTLPIELSFYLVLPFITVFLAWKRRWLLLGLALAVMVGWRWLVVDVLHAVPTTLWATQLPGAFDSFAIGMFGAILHTRFYEQGSMDKDRYRLVLKWLLPIAVIGFAVTIKWMTREYTTYWKSSPLFYLWTPVYSLTVLTIILAGAARLVSVDAILGNRAIRFVGLISYGVYLWHYPVQKLLLKKSWIGTFEGYQFPWLLLIGAVLTFVAATLSWLLVEKRAIASCHTYLKNK